MSMEDKAVLFTNLKFVHLHGVRTHSHALILRPNPHPHPDEQPFELYGYSTDPSVVVFSERISSFDYELIEYAPYTLMRVGELALQLVHENRDESVRADRFLGESADERAQSVLTARVRQFWTGRGFPKVTWETK